MEFLSKITFFLHPGELAVVSFPKASAKLHGLCELTKFFGKKFLEKLVFVKWKDSYGVDTGWKDISEYSASLLEIKSLGKVIYEDKEIISLAQNFSDETDYNPEQANGIMVIPKACISEIISFSFSQLLELEQK